MLGGGPNRHHLGGLSPLCSEEPCKTRETKSPIVKLLLLFYDSCLIYSPDGRMYGGWWMCETRVPYGAEFEKCLALDGSTIPPVLGSAAAAPRVGRKKLWHTKRDNRRARSPFISLVGSMVVGSERGEGGSPLGLRVRWFVNEAVCFAFVRVVVGWWRGFVTIFARVRIISDVTVVFGVVLPKVACTYSCKFYGATVKKGFWGL